MSFAMFGARTIGMIVCSKEYGFSSRIRNRLMSYTGSSFVNAQLVAFFFIRETNVEVKYFRFQFQSLSGSSGQADVLTDLDAPFG